MSPQPSNRQVLLEGTLRCLERLPPDRITARAIAAESGANLASIAYHYGSKDALITAAVVAGLDRWLAEIGDQLAAVETAEPATRFRLAAQALEASRETHAGLARTFAAALGRAQHDPRVRETLARGFASTRPVLATHLGLGQDQAGQDAAALVHSLFTGLLLQTLLDPGLGLEGGRMHAAQARLRDILPRS